MTLHNAFTQEQVLDILRVIAPNLAEGAIVVVERSSRDAEPAWNSQLRRFAMKKYGETVLYYLEPDESYAGYWFSNPPKRECFMLAICPGSFDPIHHGHLEIIARAATLFE